ncbi:hypothetical protein AB0E67_34975 [Streptomyces sp. NPDC032161]|uniref:hypothetical protein n=1 Tax=unclassified Streptomyces TaxID=2593676 RepID=UPI0033EDFF92
MKARARTSGSCSGRSGLTHVAFTVALEEMGDPAAVPHLLDWLARGPDLPAGDVHRALVRLTGRDPLVPEWCTAQEYSAHVRRVWPSLDLAAQPVPEVRDLVADSPSRLRFSLSEGRGRIRIDYDPPLRVRRGRDGARPCTSADTRSTASAPTAEPAKRR